MDGFETPSILVLPENIRISKRDVRGDRPDLPLVGMSYQRLKRVHLKLHPNPDHLLFCLLINGECSTVVITP